MSWISVSLPNPFKSQESDEDNLTEKLSESSSHGGGVKEDFSELGKTIGRQLWGVASFLAPPPVTPSHPSVSSSSQTLLGIRNDFAEIGGRFKSGFSLLSTNKAVNGISRLASNLLLFEEEGNISDDGDNSSGEDPGLGIVGVTEEVLEFVREISMRPEFWIDFPLLLDDDFDMSDPQREHASTVEHLAPSLAALRLRLCPSYMNDGHFWMVYFILLHPRLNEPELKLLSTPQIAEARDILLQKLQKRKNKLVESSKIDDSCVEVSSKGNSIQQENNPVQEKEFLNETVNAARQIDIDEQENIEQWLEEEDVDTGSSIDAHKQLVHEEDISFSDLDDDDNDISKKPGLRTVQDTGSSSPNGSNDWVQLSEDSEIRGGREKAVRPTSREKDSEGESSDWLNVDDSDPESLGNV